MLESRHLLFEPVGTKPTSPVDIIAKRGGELLGRIIWYAPWRKFVFSPAPDTVWDNSCLEDVRRAMERVSAAKARGGDAVIQS